MGQIKTMISTDHAPAAIGPYSQAVRVGEMVFTSGQVALDPASGTLVAGGVREQTARVLENLAAVLEAAGLDLSHVVKTTVFLKDMGDFAAMNEVYARHFAAKGAGAKGAEAKGAETEDAVPPARSTVEVARLPKDALVEIEAIAIKAVGRDEL